MILLLGSNFILFLKFKNQINFSNLPEWIFFLDHHSKTGKKDGELFSCHFHFFKHLRCQEL